MPERNDIRQPNILTKKSTVGLKLGLNVSSHALRSFVHDVGSLKKMIFLSRTYEKHGKQSSLYAYRSTYVCGLVCDDKAIKITTETDKKVHSKKAYKHSYCFFLCSKRKKYNECV